MDIHLINARMTHYFSILLTPYQQWISSHQRFDWSVSVSSSLDASNKQTVSRQMATPYSAPCAFDVRYMPHRHLVSNQSTNLLLLAILL